MVPDELLKFKGQPGFEYLDNFGHGTKKCTRCKEVKDTALFNRQATGKGGLAWECRECSKERNREHLAKYRERTAEKSRDPNYHKTCPKCGVTKSSENFYRNRSTKDSLDYHCRDCVIKRGQAFRKDNPNYQREYRERERRKEEMARAIATVSGRYSPEEDLVILDNTLTGYQKAVKLSRSLKSVYKRKDFLKRKGITNVSNYPQV